MINSKQSERFCLICSVLQVVGIMLIGPVIAGLVLTTGLA